MAKRSFHYSVTLRVVHPAMPAPEISRLLAMEPRYSWTAGEIRRAPNGRVLEGVRGESYCSIDAAKGEDGELAAALKLVVGRLSKREDRLRSIISTGGEIMLLVYWHAEGDEGETFDAALLAAIANLGIDLGLNVLALSDVWAEA